jgi:glucose-1-phosphate cytidylyltransferase
MMENNKIKVVILAGGKGTRISQYTQKIPKPMIRVGNIPMLTHIMRLFKFYGFNNFIIAGGYKIDVIKKYYLNSKEFKNLKIVFTGKNELTGGRILKLKKYLKNDESFFLTYGDGVSNINLKKLLSFHLKNKKIATVTAVRPPVKFGELSIEKNFLVKSFLEKPQISKGWINGGFFLLNKKIFNYILKTNTMFEQEPLKKLIYKKQLNAFKHNGYWMCMDNLNEKNQLEKIYKEKKTIWKIN